jgi:uncharacterized membrane protein YbjE (DUF340 family)
MNSIEATPSADTEIAKPAYFSIPIYFPVSVIKLLVLSICTLGLYELYWFYKNWQSVKQREQSNIMPVWRTIFALFFCYALLRRVRDDAKKINTIDLAAGPLAIGFMITSVLWRLPDPFSLVSLLAVLFLLPVQRAANRINAEQAPLHKPNAHFSAWNIVTIIIGGIILILSVMGMLFPPE